MQTHKWTDIICADTDGTDFVQHEGKRYIHLRKKQNGYVNTDFIYIITIFLTEDQLKK